MSVESTTLWCIMFCDLKEEETKMVAIMKRFRMGVVTSVVGLLVLSSMFFGQQIWESAKCAALLVSCLVP